MKSWFNPLSRHLKLIGLVALFAAILPVYGQEAVADAAPVAPAPAFADMAAFEASPGYALFTANNIWMMLATGLVFIMHLGFATVETGLTRSKNTCNILFKNTIIPCIGLLTYALGPVNTI